MKRITSLIIAAVLLCALALPASAAHVSIEEAAENLAALGLLRGTENGFELERTATRAEAAVMLLRLLGKETEALRETAACPFDDGGWAAPQLTYAWKNGFVKGQTAAHYGSGETVGCRDYITMLLRALGYSDAQGDFSWAQCIAFADRIGLTHGEYTADGEFLRGDLALLSYTALTLPMKSGGRKLIEQLYLDGAVSGAALRRTRLSFAADTDRRSYDAMEIHERGISAVVLLETYADEMQLENGKAGSHGSGFFVTGDGIAALCYHELDGKEYARVTTLDGHCYDVTGVLYYDAMWDVALVRVSRTDLEGRTVRSFPYLDLGDSDAVCAGERVYTLSNALGRIDNVTDGVLSNRSRIVDDPDYPLLQLSAPISPGSSGGALFNRFGEVIGILFGAFNRGEDMNLAIPVNVLADIPLTGDGVTLSEIKKTMDEQKAAATLQVSQTRLELTCGEEAEIVVTHTAPTTASIRYDINGIDIVTCIWGEFVTKRSVPLTIKAVGNGEATVTISFDDDGFGENAAAEIQVIVTGGPEA